MDNELLVKSIRELCKQNNVAISQLEKELNFGAGLISRWTKNSPSLDKIVDIADYFHVSLDEVVGYTQNTNDEFLNKLIYKTEHKIIKWESYDNTNNQPKQYYKYFNLSVDDFFDIDEFNDFLSFHKEKSYYFKIDNGYICIYGQYNGFDIFKPEELKLFIQPTKDSELVPQSEYTTKQLIALWLKILYNIETDAPDEIKAEELKNSFILNESKNNDKNIISYKNDFDSIWGKTNIEKVLKNPNINQLIKTFSTPENQKLIELLNNPNIQDAVKLIERLKTYNNELNE